MGAIDFYHVKSSLENPISTQTMGISTCVNVSDIKLYGADYQQGQKFMRKFQETNFFFSMGGSKNHSTQSNFEEFKVYTEDT